MARLSVSAPGGRVMAVLGPTNTGKTHYAVETMLDHSSGVIGLPLRLLAREVYDKVAARKGRRAVALVTGEEKIVPPGADYFVCTVEAMPTGRSFDFVAIDEIQLAADPERGHVFTDRLLRARGLETTLFLGAETIRPLLTRLVPEAEVHGRPRLSALRYAGPRKISRLPRRSAIIAFSADDVYAIAELVRRQRGGAAVVLGALSPRTRNAQVALYQAGEVDFLVATDAIGMGLNMDIDHVAFARLRKFDGRGHRDLSAAEIGQIAGRAGRYLNDGSFGTTAEVGPLDQDLIAALQSHRFEPVKRLRWRNPALEFASPRELMRSLEAPAPSEVLLTAREADDARALASLAALPEIAERATGPARVKLLWQVCQIPDFRKTLHDSHVRLLARLFRHLADDGRLPSDWVAAQIAPLSEAKGDIDTLSARLAHMRTWAFVAHRGDWLDDAAHWRGRTREIEDRLSDALHERLALRFVDRGTAALSRRLKDRGAILAAIDDSGTVLVEGRHVGSLQGLRFRRVREATESRAWRTAVNRALARALDDRVRRLARAADRDIRLGDDGRLWWRGAAIATLAKGDRVLKPRLVALAGDQVSASDRRVVEDRLRRWLDARVAAELEALIKLEDIPFSGPARGIAYQLVEGLGVLAVAAVRVPLRQLEAKDYGRFKYGGVRLGRRHVFATAVLKPAATWLRLVLWALWHGRPPPAPPVAGRVSFPVGADADRQALAIAGFERLGGLAFRIDMLDRVLGAIERQARKGPVTQDVAHLALLGCGPDDFAALMRGLGYRRLDGDAGADGAPPLYARPERDRTQKNRQRQHRPAAPDSPFAVLKDLAVK